ncbi:uncharacterized protein LOC111302797 isoform X3 [Durio zibethinus]|uniref:Uncharacterized protein LOC111302797 isoform X3 n=1 Tax=Durio zibethinus TaxID=66656 RepID=A0A6P5ZPS0_DURZI|nr:uncharacterized protein LOC111302797 isoform X3 [Durio zibethinus]
MHSEFIYCLQLLIHNLLVNINNSTDPRGIEWSLYNDASNASVLVVNEVHAIFLAIDGLLGVVFIVTSLTDEAVDAGEVNGNVAYVYMMLYALKFFPNFIFSWYNQLESL